jgi:hypothetical protein
MTNAWDHLPNAKLIDRVLADLRARPQVWDAARDAALDAALDAAWDAARGAARGAAWGAARDAARVAARYAARAAARDASWGASWDAALDACAALIAWDDASLLLDMPVDAVRLLAASGHHPAFLMLPACIALGVDAPE